MSESSCNERLFAAACAYYRRGWSVIPIHGDALPDRAKVAAVPWGEFQHRRPTLAEMASWFLERRYAGLAVVTGGISRLAVLDFDAEEVFSEFQRQCPELAQTHTVQTRRGCHLYYELPPALNAPSKKVEGVDWQSEGRYVVAPTTVIDGHVYQPVDDYPLQRLNSQNVLRIQAFLEAQGAVHPPADAALELPASTLVSEAIMEERREQLTARDLVALYRSLAGRGSRNASLFQVSLRARDAGWSGAEVKDFLADTHAWQPTSITHRVETYESRQREAVRTIDSAFSRPPYPARQRPASQLPNSVREALLRQGQTYTLRVIEALQLRGIRPGQPFTYAEAVHLLRGLVGQWSIRLALVARTPAGQLFFSAQTLSPGPHTPVNTDRHRGNSLKQNAFCLLRQNQQKYRPGRPARVFTMPGAYQLCELLGVNRSPSDPLDEDDLASARKTRQALHREYIKRRPGQYPRSVLAARLGLSVRSTQRYNLATPIHVRSMHFETAIYWSTLNSIPTGFEVKGSFLQDETGKRYPPKQEIAMRLLSQRRSVTYRRRDVNYYSCGDAPPDFPMSRLRADWGEIQARQTRVQLYVSQNVPVPIERHAPRPETQAGSERAVTSLPPGPMPLSGQTAEVGAPPVLTSASPPGRRHFRRPLTDPSAEALAQAIHKQTNPNSDGNTNGMSIFNARRLVELYGVNVVEKTLKRMRWLQERGKILNSAGFMIIASRVAWRLEHGATELGNAAPRFKGEPARKGRNFSKGPSHDPL